MTPTDAPTADALFQRGLDVLATGLPGEAAQAFRAALSISLQAAGHVPEAEAAAARARVLEWKIQLHFPSNEDALP